MSDDQRDQGRLPRMGKELTAPFMPTHYSNEWQIRVGEDLAQSFCELHDHTDLDEEPMRELFIRADDAIAALLAEIWKRSEQESREREQNETS